MEQETKDYRMPGPVQEVAANEQKAVEAFRQAVSSRLAEGESLIWSGRPKPSAYGWREWLPVAFGSVFLGASTALLAFFVWHGFIRRDPTGNGPPPFAIVVVFGGFLAVFFAIGSWLVRRYWVSRREAASIGYALTDRRAILMEYRSGKVEWLECGRSEWNHCRVRRWVGGTGRVIFRRRLGTSRSGQTGPAYRYFQFEAVLDFAGLAGTMRERFSEFQGKG